MEAAAGDDKGRRTRRREAVAFEGESRREDLSPLRRFPLLLRSVIRLGRGFQPAFLGGAFDGTEAETAWIPDQTLCSEISTAKCFPSMVNE